MWVDPVVHKSKWSFSFMLNILRICFLEFTVNHKLSLNLTQNELFGVDPAVHMRPYGILQWNTPLYMTDFNGMHHLIWGTSMEYTTLHWRLQWNTPPSMGCFNKIPHLIWETSIKHTTLWDRLQSNTPPYIGDFNGIHHLTKDTSMEYTTLYWILQ